MKARPLHSAKHPASESEASQAGRQLAHLSWGNTLDRTARTAPARAAMEARWLELAGGDPDRAESLRKAHYVGMALKSAVARRKNREARQSSANSDAA
jgi:hypothetical protein